MAKKVLGWVIVIFLIYFIATHPASAALMAKSMGSGMVTIATGIGDFFSHLAT